MIDPIIKVSYEAPNLPQDANYLAKDDPLTMAQIKGFFPAVTGVPTDVPTSWQNQIRIVRNDPFVYLYIYDFNFNQWRPLQF